MEMIYTVGFRLKISPWGIATAARYCHTFYSLKLMRKNDRFLITAACLHLGAKVQECPKSVKDIIRECDFFRFSGNQRKQQECSDPAKMEEKKEELFMAERALLYTLGFDLEDSTAFSYLLNYLGDLGLGSKNSTDASSFVVDPRFKVVPQTAWDYLYESYRTQACLKLEPRKMASAAIYMADQGNQHEPGSIPIVDLVNEQEAAKNSGKVRASCLRGMPSSHSTLLIILQVHDFCSYFDISPPEIKFFIHEVLGIYEVAVDEDEQNRDRLVSEPKNVDPRDTCSLNLNDGQSAQPPPPAAVQEMEVERHPKRKLEEEETAEEGGTKRVKIEPDQVNEEQSMLVDDPQPDVVVVKKDQTEGNNAAEGEGAQDAMVKASDAQPDAPIGSV